MPSNQASRDRDQESAPSAGISPLIGVTHVGMHARDPKALAAFYRETMGMHRTGHSETTEAFGASEFLSSRPDKRSHDLVFFEEEKYRHIAFEVETLAALRQFHEKIVRSGIEIEMSFHHGVSIAFYFNDPEGNMIEVFWDTGVRYQQPYGEPVDISAPENVLMERVAALRRQYAE